MWTATNYTFSVPETVPGDQAIVEEGGKRFKVRHVVAKLDSFPLVEKEKLLSLNVWESCQTSFGTIFKFPGNWIRIAKFPLIDKQTSIENVDPQYVEDESDSNPDADGALRW